MQLLQGVCLWFRPMHYLLSATFLSVHDTHFGGSTPFGAVLPGSSADVTQEGQTPGELLRGSSRGVFPPQTSSCRACPHFFPRHVHRPFPSSSTTSMLVMGVLNHDSSLSPWALKYVVIIENFQIRAFDFPIIELTTQPSECQDF